MRRSRRRSRWPSRIPRPATSAAAASWSSTPAGKGEPVVIDYRETAPAAATRTMFTQGRQPSTATRSSACPAPCAAWRWPTRSSASCPGRTSSCRRSSWPRRASSLDAHLAGSLNGIVGRVERLPRAAARLRQERRQGDWKAGDRLVQTDLAQDAAADRRARGRTPSTQGAIADLIVAEMKAGGGLITKDDLAGYQAKERKPIHGTYRGYDVYGPPPPSSGGICLVADAQHPGELRPARSTAAGRPRRCT